MASAECQAEEAADQPCRQAMRGLRGIVAHDRILPFFAPIIAVVLCFLSSSRYNRRRS